MYIGHVYQKNGIGDDSNIFFRRIRCPHFQKINMALKPVWIFIYEITNFMIQLISLF